VLLAWPLVIVLASSTSVNPIEKVCGLIEKLQHELIQEGREVQSVYNSFAGMCEDRSRELHREIKSAKGQVSELTATIEKATADIAVTQEKISDVAGNIADAEGDLKKANDIRADEAADFAAEEKELLTAISSIERSAAIAAKDKGASFAQTQSSQGVLQVLSTIVDASALSSYDSSTLTSLVQSSSDEDDEFSAKKASGKAVTDTLDDLLEKASAKLGDARKSEKEAQRAHAMVTMSLENRIKVDNKELAELKKNLAALKEKKASAEGDLEGTKKDLAQDAKEVKGLHHECITKASNFQESVTSRGEELKALTVALKIIRESTGGAEKKTYSLVETSFLQVKSDIVPSSRALRVVRRLAWAHHSDAFVQLASRMETVIRHSAITGLDPFKSVRNMLRSMMEKLEGEGEAEASKKSFCDKEMAESKAKLDDKEHDVEKLSTELEVIGAWSKKLKGEVAGLQKEIGLVTKAQAEMDLLRSKEKTLYKKNRPQLEQGLEGVTAAMKVLREYYAQDDDSQKSSKSGGGGIIGMLEVVSSDFSKGLADMTSEEEASQREYESETKQNAITKAEKQQDVKHKTREFKALDKGMSEMNSDRDSAQDEVDAIQEYTSQIKKECVANPDSFEEKKKRREEELGSLREAQATLKGEAALLQTQVAHRRQHGAAIRLQR